MRIRARPIQSRRTYKDSTPDENLQAGRAGASGQDIDLFDVNEGTPLVPRELHGLARHINSRAIDREEDFITFDYHLCRLSHARTLLDLCLGELLSAFRKADGKAYGEMGYSRLDDFAEEHLSFSGRLASEMILCFERLQTLPLTREAYMRGDIVKSALRLLLRVMTKENEAELLSEIRELSVREIDELVKAKLRAARMCDGQKNMAGGDAAEAVTEMAGAATGEAGDVGGKAGAAAVDAAGKAAVAAGDVAGKAGAAGDVATGYAAPGDPSIDSYAAGDTTIADTKGDSAADAPGEDTAVAPKEGSDVVPSITVAGDVTEAVVYPEEQISEEQISEEQVSEDQESEDQESEDIPSEEADREEGSGVVMKFNVSRTLALTWDFALEHFRENYRTKGPLYGFVEALVSCFLDSTADFAVLKSPISSDGQEQAAGSVSGGEPETNADVTEESGPASVGGREVPLLYNDAIWDCFPSEREMRSSGRDGGLTPSETGDCRAAESGGSKSEDPIEAYPDPQNEERLRQIREELALQPFIVKLPGEYSQIPCDSYALARRIIRVASMRQSIDYHIGWFLKAVRDRYLFRLMEFSKIEDYAKARINISASTTFRLIRLVSYFSNHPVIEKAFLKRKITREQAYLIASLEDGRHEKIWLDFAMSRPARELRDEVSRMLRIREYDYFAPHNYALIPGFRYITDDRYDGLSDEMKDILRTGAWYKGPGSQWPLPSHDEHCLDKDFAERLAEETNTTRLSKYAANPGESSDLTESYRLSKCEPNSGESSDLTESSRLSKCAPNLCKSSDPIDSSRLLKWATDSGEEAGQANSTRLSKCAPDVEIGARLCREADRRHSDEALEQARALCALRDRHRPAMTLLLDVLESMAGQDGGDASSPSSDSGVSVRSSGSAEPGVPPASDISDISAAGGFHSQHREPTMSIRFFLPRGLYGVWNDAVRRYVSLVSPDDGIELLVNNEGVENFIAILLTDYLLAEKAHHKAAHNNKVLERDGYRCQVPGCSSRRNIHSHHLEFRSHGGSDASPNRLSLCACHHLWILHILHGLKVEGTAPDKLTFTFGPCSGPEGQPFMIYRSGRKALSAPQTPVDT